MYSELTSFQTLATEHHNLNLTGPWLHELLFGALQAARQTGKTTLIPTWMRDPNPAAVTGYNRLANSQEVSVTDTCDTRSEIRINPWGIRLGCVTMKKPW